MTSSCNCPPLPKFMSAFGALQTVNDRRYPWAGRCSIEIGLDRVEYALREGKRRVIRHEMEEVELTRENPLMVRPVSRR
jgi:hypothetical protein